MSSKRNAKYQKTMEYILIFLRHMKSKRYNDIYDLLYNIRTNDLREMLENLGPDHFYYRTVLEILSNPALEYCYSEALYNLAVILGEKANVPALIRHGALDVILSFKASTNNRILHNACWCLFGIAASDPDHRKLCIDNGVLELAVNLMLTSAEDNIVDICGQIIYGIFHMRPYPTYEMAKPFFDHIVELLKLPENSLKYILWSLHFGTTEKPEILKSLNVESCLNPLIKSQQSTLLIPLMIIIAAIFKITSTDLHEYLNALKSPLTHYDANVRLQTCRTVAEYVRNESSIDDMLNGGVYEIVIKMSNEDDQRVKEQAVYAILRGFGLGSRVQKQKLATIGGLEVILNYSAVAASPFNSNLLDCMDSLVEEDYEFFSKKLKEINAVNIFYKLLASNDQVLTSKAANLLGLVGDEYSKDIF
ncbi:hypothetical protein TRFO_04878 [Tritrichomonas foetus]|uniref:Armadillo/beta-catenin-like repeat family protein n=1 Tax=Tritrichomonas foetus TaxID=1144522 RepID=A0A1J4KG05_9EUKA|nr:hypothetical protein TRFO_04878 [Tritrichomonas foetus]|eukprot:OHT08277.1 hypothetical protein TRFO_04878 [Tritrichomonas foetus]